MKKLVLTIAVILGMTFSASAQYFGENNGGLFHRGATPNGDKDGTGINSPILPNHGLSDNQDANETPLGSGALLLVGFGAAYVMAKKNRK